MGAELGVGELGKLEVCCLKLRSCEVDTLMMSEALKLVAFKIL